MKVMMLLLGIFRRGDEGTGTVNSQGLTFKEENLI